MLRLLILAALSVAFTSAQYTVFGNGQEIDALVRAKNPHYFYGSRWEPACVGVPSPKRFTIRNDHTAPIRFTVPEVEDDVSGSFSVDASVFLPLRLPPGQSSTFNVVYKPNQHKYVTANIRFTAADDALSFVDKAASFTLKVGGSGKGNPAIVYTESNPFEIPIETYIYPFLEEATKSLVVEFKAKSGDPAGCPIGSVTSIRLADATWYDANGDAIPLSGDDFQLLGVTGLPWNLGSEKSFKLQFTPSRPGDYWVNVVVSTDGMEQAFNVRGRKAGVVPLATETQEPKFDWGQSCAPSAGVTKFTKTLPNDRDEVVLGDIPAGKFDVYIKLTASVDLDIRLYDVSAEGTAVHSEGEAIVKWCTNTEKKAENPNCNGLGTAGVTSMVYQGMKVEYSGYNGVDKQKGNEYIKIIGMTRMLLRMKVYAYTAGSATVEYSYGQGCGGVFSQTLKTKEIVEVGKIPKGQMNLHIDLESKVDVDIQLYDLDDTSKWPEGQAIIAYCDKSKPSCNFGPMALNKANKLTYQGNEYAYSGYNGVASNKGKEYVDISGASNRNLMMKIYGYAAGFGKITYWYNATSP